MESENYWDNVKTQGTESIFCPGNVDMKPPANSECLRVYNNPLCPFAERGRLALAARGLTFQEANIDLNYKPAYFVEAGGTVPVLEKQDGTLIAGSDEVIKYAHEEGSGIEIIPQDENEREQQQEYIKKFDNGRLIMEMISAVFQGGESHIHKLTSELEKMEDALNENDKGNRYFNNKSEITLVDILLSPILTRAVYTISEKIHTVETIDLIKYPKIANYVIDITSHPKIGLYIAPKIGWLNYVLSRLKNDIKLPYPLDFTPLVDSQSQKQLYVLNAHTAKPRTNENFIRIYGHPLCPFVERALLAFQAKKVEYQFCGVDLTEKNQWHKDINGGLVPFIELPDGKIIIESTGVAEWVQTFSNEGVNLYPGDGLNKERLQESVESLFKIGISIILAAFKKEERDADGPTKFIESLENLNKELEKSDSEYFVHQEYETMADLMTFPFVHRAFLTQGTSLKENYYDKIDFDKIQKLHSWYDKLYEKYKDSTAKQVDFAEHMEKNIEADGPKVQLYYPIPSES